MPITAILIPVADCVLLLHQLVIGPVTVHFNVMVFKCTHHTTCITLNVLQTGCTVASQLGFEPCSPVWQAGSRSIKPSGLAWGGGVQTLLKKKKRKAAGVYCGIFSMFFPTPFYTTFSNQTFARTVCTFFFEICLIFLGYWYIIVCSLYFVKKSEVTPIFFINYIFFVNLCRFSRIFLRSSSDFNSVLPDLRISLQTCRF